MMLAIDIKHSLGDFRLDARFQTGGGLIALFGRSGSGKTSIINIIAGLIRPEQGHVTVGDDILVDTARGVFNFIADSSGSRSHSPSDRSPDSYTAMQYSANGVRIGRHA